MNWITRGWNWLSEQGGNVISFVNALPTEAAAIANQFTANQAEAAAEAAAASAAGLSAQNQYLQQGASSTDRGIDSNVLIFGIIAAVVAIALWKR